MFVVGWLAEGSWLLFEVFLMSSQQRDYLIFNSTQGAITAIILEVVVFETRGERGTTGMQGLCRAEMNLLV